MGVMLPRTQSLESKVFNDYFLFLVLFLYTSPILDNECSQVITFENGNQPKGIDYYVVGSYFLIVLNDPPAVYKKPMHGIHYIFHSFNHLFNHNY